MQYTVSAREMDLDVRLEASVCAPDASACTVTIWSVQTDPFDGGTDCPSPDGGYPTNPAAQHCVAVRLGGPATFAFYLPPASGSYRLEDLTASVCDRDCSLVTGDLEVKDVALPCGEGGCGRFEADVTVEPPAVAIAGAPSLSGTAHLHYVELPYSYSECGGGGCSSGYVGDL
jgi:hypothetical protein